MATVNSPATGWGPVSNSPGARLLHRRDVRVREDQSIRAVDVGAGRQAHLDDRSLPPARRKQRVQLGRRQLRLHYTGQHKGPGHRQGVSEEYLIMVTFFLGVRRTIMVRHGRSQNVVARDRAWPENRRAVLSGGISVRACRKQLTPGAPGAVVSLRKYQPIRRGGCRDPPFFSHALTNERGARSSGRDPSSLISRQE